MYWEALTALKEAIAACLTGLSCEYTFLVSLGEPPAQCNMIAFYLKGSERSSGESTACITTFSTSFNISITRCCATSDSGLEFDPAKEEHEAQCFLEDLSALRSCLGCESSAALNDYDMSCGATIEAVDVDPEKQGGCYTAVLELSITEQECC